MNRDNNATVVAFGEILWDLLPSGPVIGGAPFNFTYRINELGHQGYMVSRLGTDEYGQRAQKRVAQLQIPADYLQTDDNHPTGTVAIELDAKQEPHYTIIPQVAYDYIEYTDTLRELVQQADCLCFGTLAQRNEVSRNTLRQMLDDFKGQYLLYDINLRPNTYTSKVIQQSLAHATVLKLNEEEAAEIADLCALTKTDLPDIGRALVDHYQLIYCVITLGERGVLALSNRDECYYVPTFEVNLVDPLGAGDAFTAGFMHALLWEQPLRQSCRFGNALGATVAGQAGGTQPVAGSHLKDQLRRGRSGPIDSRFNHLFR